MSAIKEIKKSACVAWSPIREHREYIALGSVGINPVMEICEFDLSSHSNKMHVISSAQSEKPLHCLVWDKIKPGLGGWEYGIIAAGMNEGIVSIWNPKNILKYGDGPPLVTLTQPHRGTVTCLEFNPHRCHVLASGGLGGDFHVIDLEKPTQLAVYEDGPNNDQGEVTCLSWNRKVSYILATASNSGVTTIWDLKQRKPSIFFRDPANRQRPSSLSWLPEQATQIIVAYDDDRNPSLQMWDLRNASYPLRDTAGHTKGILDTQFCPADPNLMLSCGKDNRTVCWSFANSQPEVFTEILSQQWHFQVGWAPFYPGIFSASSHTDKISIFSMQTVRSKDQLYIPAWHKSRCGVNCGFGGKIVYFDSSSSTINCQIVPTEAELTNHADSFEKLKTVNDYKGYCQQRLDALYDPYEKMTWGIMKQLFDYDRVGLLEQLGYSISSVHASVEKCLGRSLNGDNIEKANAESQHRQTLQHIPQPTVEVDPEKFFQELSEKSLGDMPLPETSNDADVTNHYDGDLKPVDWTSGPEKLLKHALLVGDIEAAVELCLECGRMTEALIFASTSSKELWERTREKCILRQQDTFLGIIGCAVLRRYDLLVESTDLTQWKETLAILCTYAPSEEFESLCVKLANRLEHEKFDIRASLICYLCAGNFHGTVEIWSNMAASCGSLLLGLQDIVEKMTILKAATRFNEYNRLLSQNITKYAEFLANSGRTVAAMRFLCLLDSNASSECDILKERIYNSSPSSMIEAGLPAPPSPFEVDTELTTAVPVVSAHAPSNSMGKEEPLHQISHSSRRQFSGMSDQNTWAPQAEANVPQIMPTPPVPINRGPFQSTTDSARLSSIPSHLSAENQVQQPQQSPMPPPAYGFQPTYPVSQSYSNPPAAPKPPIFAPSNQKMPDMIPGSTQTQNPYTYINQGQSRSGAVMRPINPAAPPLLHEPRKTLQEPVLPQDPNISSVTAPTAGAAAVSPGMPVPWPVPTPMQQKISQTTITAEANKKIQATATADKPLGSPMPAGELAYVTKILGELYRMHAHSDPSGRKADDLNKRLNELLDKLKSGFISESACAKIILICRYVESNDMVAANKIQVSLSTTDWDAKNKNWLLGLKRLLATIPNSS